MPKQKFSAGLVADNSLNIVEFIGRPGPYVDFAPGTASLKLARVLNPRLRSLVLDTLAKARESGKPVESSPSPFYFAGESRHVAVRVTPLEEKRGLNGGFRIEFSDGPARAIAQESRPKKDDASPEDKAQAEMEAVRGQLQEAILDHEMAGEELRNQLATLRHQSESTAAELEEAYSELEAQNQQLQTSLELTLVAEERLQQANAFLKAILDNADALILVLDRKAHIVQMNAACERATGRTLKELQGRTTWRLIPADERGRAKKAFGRVLEEDYPNRWEGDWIAKDGSRVRLMWSNSAIRDAAGEIQYVVSIGINITRRRKAEQALHESESRIRALLDAAGQAVVAVDTQGRISFSNQAAERLFGYRPGELNSKNLRELIPPRFRPAHEKYHETYFKAPETRAMGTGLGLDLHACRSDGTEFPVEVSLGHFDTSSGVAAVAFVTDITERRRLESQRDRALDEMKQLSARLLTAKEDEARRYARELHDGITQDLVALGIGLSALVEHCRDIDDSRKATLERLAATSRRLAETARHLSHEIHPAALDHLDLSGALQSLRREFAGYTDVDVSVAVSRKLPGLAKPQIGCIYRIVQEALWNVARHSGTKQASVRIGYRNGFVTARVRDKGTGFDPASVETARGLGLISMQERAHLCGGGFSIKSLPGRGTLVEARMPVMVSNGGAAC